MSFVNFIFMLAGFKCSKCRFQFKVEDLQRAQSQMKLGALVCPKCQNEIQRFRGLPILPNITIDKSSYQKLRSKIKIEHSPRGALKITIPWLNPLTLLILAFGVFVISFGRLVYLVAIQEADRIFQILAIGIPLIGGFASFTTTLLQIFNSRHIIITQEKISFYDGPLWPFELSTIPVSNIKNLSLNREIESVSRDRRIFFSNKIELRLKDERIVLLCKVFHFEDSVIVERAIEQYLGIKDDTSLDTVKGI